MCIGVGIVINFIVVEDNQNHRKRTKDIIVNYMMKNKIEFDILFFETDTPTLDELIEHHDTNYVYILDFELPNTTAIDISRKIRKFDWISPIIVFTVNGGMAMETFKQRLQLHELFDICLEQLKLKQSFRYKIGKVDYSIDLDKILYIYKDTVERKSVIVTDIKEYKVPLNLIKIKELLPEYFVFTHKACIVNSNRAQAYVWNENKVIFDNGKEAPFLSKTHKKELSGSEVG